MVATETGVSEIDIFVSTTDNLNTITFDRVKVNIAKHRTFRQRDRLCWPRGLKFRKVDNGTFQKIVVVFTVGHRAILLASGQLANFDYTPGHLSFEMPCSFADQVLPQLIC